MSTFRRLLGCVVLIGLLSGGLKASAQAGPVPAVSPQTQRVSDYLADALRLNRRQALRLRAALQKRLDATEVLSHLLFVSDQAATAAYDTADFQYYVAMRKLLSPSQFHQLMQLDQPLGAAEAPVMVQKP
jgi:hypothetical protein